MHLLLYLQLRLSTADAALLTQSLEIINADNGSVFVFLAIGSAETAPTEWQTGWFRAFTSHLSCERRPAETRQQCCAAGVGGVHLGAGATGGCAGGLAALPMANVAYGTTSYRHFV